MHTIFLKTIKTGLKFISQKNKTSNSKNTIQQLVNTFKSKAQIIVCVRKFTVGTFAICKYHISSITDTDRVKHVAMVSQASS